MEPGGDTPGAVIGVDAQADQSHYLSMGPGDGARHDAIALVLDLSVVRNIDRWMRETLPEEGCGLLSARDGTDEVMFWPITNAVSPARAAHAFQMEESEYLATLRILTRTGHRLLGVVHSHPTGPPQLSELDVSAAWGGTDVHHLVMDMTKTGVAALTSWDVDYRGVAIQERIHVRDE